MITKFNFNDRTIKSYAIRKLTPFECFRLMGVRDAVIHTMQMTWGTAWDRIKSFFTGKKGKDDDMVISANQQYKQTLKATVIWFN